MAIIQMPQRASAFWSDTSVADWDEESLRALVAGRLASDQVIVASDRQPFSHERLNGQLVVTQPASGLVTAVEPIVRACGGTWVAHGSGTADREAVDDTDVWHSPTAGGSYRLRRLWMTTAETRTYRDGFANSGLWPLCHMVHVRPSFVEQDWQQYQRVNRRFADAIVEEANQPDPVILIHDYHLALVPAMVRERLPRATIVSFWHIPWTSPEQMSICPWLPAVVDGLLGSDIVGFQTDQHRKNFVASAEECGVGSGKGSGKESGKESGKNCVEDMSRSPRRRGTGRSHKTLVRDYPISVAWPVKSKPLQAVSGPAKNAVALSSARLSHEKLIVGIDRFDYTKGLIERLHAVEHLLTYKPEWCGRLKFVQVAAPSRTSLPDYVAFRAQVFKEVQRINDKFATEHWEPIALRDSHHDHAAVQALYQAADICLVTSLHDGMNLVSKEFVAARDDEQGVLVLSEFAGASHELTSALIVNPYHTAQVADALHKGLVMPAAEQRHRMQSLRATVKKHNVYRWAAHMLLDATDLRNSRGAERPLQPVNGLLARA